MPITTLAIQNQIFGYTTGDDTTRDNLISLLIPYIQDEVIRYTGNWFLNRNVQLVASTIAFVSGSPDTITDSSEQFVECYFQDGNDIKIRYSPNNSKILTIATVAAGTLTLNTNAEIVSEDTGEEIIITQVKFPDSMHLLVNQWVKKYITPQGKSSSIVKSESLPGGYSVTFKDDREMYTMFDKWII